MFNRQGAHVTFRASDVLIAALEERARKAGCSRAEYLRSIVREKVGLH